MLNKVVDDMRNKGVTPLYLVTDHIGFMNDMDGNSYVWFKGMVNRKRQECTFTDKKMIDKRYKQE